MGAGGWVERTWGDCLTGKVLTSDGNVCNAVGNGCTTVGVRNVTVLFYTYRRGAGGEPPPKL